VRVKSTNRTRKDRPNKGLDLSEIAKEITMGLLEELAGAAVAVEGAKKLDPNAGIITEGIAAVVGFEGKEAVTNLIEKKEEENKEQQ
jgi:hypothetical protein